jgi:hypothetical protein
VYTTEEQRSVVDKRTQMQRIFIKNYFVFTDTIACHVKRFTSGWQIFRWWWRGWNGDTEVAEKTVQTFLFCGFRGTIKAMRQEYQCWWRICREINVFFFMFRISHVLRFISISNIFTDSPSYELKDCISLRIHERGYRVYYLCANNTNILGHTVVRQWNEKRRKI